MPRYPAARLLTRSQRVVPGWSVGTSVAPSVSQAGTSTMSTACEPAMSEARWKSARPFRAEKPCSDQPDGTSDTHGTSDAVGTACAIRKTGGLPGWPTVEQSGELAASVATPQPDEMRAADA